MSFWHETVTIKSFKVLQDLRRTHEFILIGGWAVWLYTKALKSKDIDIVVNFEELANLRKDFDVYKNGRLKKYEACVSEIDVDIYVPFYSNPGLPGELIWQLAKKFEGFLVPPPEVLLILKQKTYQVRRLSSKGEKDKIDIFSLLNLANFDWEEYKSFLKKNKLEDLLLELKRLIKETVQVPELKLNPHQFSRRKKKWLAALISS